MDVCTDQSVQTVFVWIDGCKYKNTTVVRMDEFMYGCMYVQLFVWMDGYTGECMHVLGLTRGRWMLKWISIS